MGAVSPTWGCSSTTMTDFLIDFAAGGVSGAISKTLTAPNEREKLVIQTQDANPKIRSGEVARYTGIGNCFTRIHSEQGLAPSGVETELTSSVISQPKPLTLPSRIPSRPCSQGTTTRPISGSSSAPSSPQVAWPELPPSPLSTLWITPVPVSPLTSDPARPNSTVLLTA